MSKKKNKRTWWGKPWMMPELLLMKEWRKEGIPLKQQAKMLNRSYRSVRSAVTSFKLAGDRYNNYQSQLRNQVLEMISLGMSQKQIKIKLNYSSHAFISVIVKELCEQGLIKKISRLKYLPTQNQKQL